MRTKTCDGPHASYASLCRRLVAISRRLRIGRRRRRTDAKKRGPELRSALDLAEIDLSFEEVAGAASVTMVLVLVPILVAAAAVIAFTEFRFIMPLALVLVALPIIAREAVLTYPRSAAAKRAARVLKASPESVNLMIMSLRHEPSLSKAIRFASRRENAYSKELRGCIWSVVMGAQSSFEDSLHALGKRWSKYSEELKDSLNAMVTASCESTEDGKRRALDRANSAMVSGAKRRIEEYALSLSAPSMIMFGLGILLPLMVGSFLPMLSWDLFAVQDPAGASGLDSASGSQSTLQMMFLMNVLFPAIAVLVAMSVISRHPLETGTRSRGRPAGRRILGLAVSMGLTALSSLAIAELFCGQLRYVLLLIVAAGPISIWLMAGRDAGTGGDEAVGLEDALFKTGSKMIDGENFESALNRAANDLGGGSSELARRLSFRTNAIGQAFDEAADLEASSPSARNAVEGLKVVKDAASKDEPAAGMLAMDLATYLRDLRELEATLKNRLKPTISMMKMTTYALGPVVLGVTYAIYLSLTSMIGSVDGVARAGAFFLVLGLFLAETNAVVSYFVWGIEGRRGRGELMYSVGACILVSELIYAATATLAS